MLFGKKVHASLATIPGRSELLPLVVRSIINQVDVLHIAFNYGGNPIPQWAIDNPKIEYTLEDNSMGDAAKFVAVEGCRGYMIICDDDIIYPTEFVARMVTKARYYKGVMTIGGANIPGRIESYYRGRKKVATAFTKKQTQKDSRVHIGATGGWVYDTDIITFPAEVFRQPNMADIYASAHCNELDVPVMCIAKNKGWIKEADPDRSGDSIYARRAEHDHIQAAVCNSVRWK